MIGFGESYLAWLASTVVPTLAGLLLITWANRFVNARYLVAFGLGLFLWFFVDLVDTSTSLGANDGFSGGAGQVVLVLLFLTAALFFVGVDRDRNIFSPSLASGKYGLIIPIMVALSLAIHGLGEGAAYSATVFATSSNSLLDAFGGLYPAVAYVLHKALEPMMIGSCYCAHVKQQRAKSGAWLGDMLLLTIVFVLPSLIGAAVGYYIMYNTTYYFALGAGASLYAGLRLTGPLFDTGETLKPSGTMRIIVCILLGILALYLAALFHSL